MNTSARYAFLRSSRITFERASQAVLQGRCREVWVFGRRISKGMAMEIEKARERNLRLRYFTEECEEVGTE